MFGQTPGVSDRYRFKQSHARPPLPPHRNPNGRDRAEPVHRMEPGNERSRGSTMANLSWLSRRSLLMVRILRSRLLIPVSPTARTMNVKCIGP